MLLLGSISALSATDSALERDCATGQTGKNIVRRTYSASQEPDHDPTSAEFRNRRSTQTFDMVPRDRNRAGYPRRGRDRLCGRDDHRLSSVPGMAADYVRQFR